MRDLTKEELKKIVDYSPGGCLCGHGESCAVCMRSEKTRDFEDLAKRAARELLRRRR